MAASSPRHQMAALLKRELDAADAAVVTDNNNDVNFELMDEDDDGCSTEDERKRCDAEDLTEVKKNKIKFNWVNELFHTSYYVYVICTFDSLKDSGTR